jgi:hypothetical protein
MSDWDGYDPEDEVAEQELVDACVDAQERLERVRIKCEEKREEKERAISQSPNVVPLKRK